MSNSYLTVTDQFCGAGGSSAGAVAAGLTIKLALNHWRLAIETHGANFPDVDHVCEDISTVDPRRYLKTDMLITSPECTNHSLAKGARRKNAGQREIFRAPVDPSAERSRATMWDVVRFAEFHRYRIIVVENVVDVRYWELWETWLLAMDRLGYLHRLVSLNSMHCHPTPQSRDRLYVVFWRKGNRAPDLDVRPEAPCQKCGDVEAVQTWKANNKSGNRNDAGRYKRQYVFTCPICRREVVPYYFCALNAIDWDIPAERIGDRKRPLKPRTLDRIRYGLEKFGRTPLVVTTNMTTDSGRVRPVTDPGFTQTGSALTGFVSPFLVETLYTQDGERRASSAGDPLPTQSGRAAAGVAMPFFVGTSYTGGNGRYAHAGEEALATQTTAQDLAICVPPPFLVKLRGTENGQVQRAIGVDEPIGTISAGGLHHGVVQGSALMTMRDHPAMQLHELTAPLDTQCGRQQAAVISRSPFLVQYYGTGRATSAAEAVPTVTGLDRHALVDPGPQVEDCYFRMLSSSELQAGMAFPASYKVLGNQRDRVKQLGNAVTPPAMAWLIRRCVASLHPEVRQ
jgi:DNA (cytosine-5)-methyltransferase 1